VLLRNGTTVVGRVGIQGRRRSSGPRSIFVIFPSQVATELPIWSRSHRASHGTQNIRRAFEPLRDGNGWIIITEVTYATARYNTIHAVAWQYVSIHTPYTALLQQIVSLVPRFRLSHVIQRGLLQCSPPGHSSERSRMVVTRQQLVSWRCWCRSYTRLEGLDSLESRGAALRADSGHQYLRIIPLVEQAGAAPSATF
jgi:hypothetical protein